MENLLTLFLIGSLATAYLVKFMLLEQKDSHFGPFPSSEKVVYFHSDYDEGGVPVPEHAQPVALFDRIRRLFGAYRIVGNVWHVKDGALAEVWTCPTCLSFWLAIPAAIFISYLTVPLLFPLLLMGLAGASVVLNVNYL